LFSKLYENTPVVTKSGGREVPVGTVIFDPDGEYFWPDDKGRPGLCDVPQLQDKLVVFTSRKNRSPFYDSFVAGGIKLDIRRLSPADVIGIALAPERQEQQNVRKLRALNQTRWRELVDIIDEHGNQSPLEDIKSLLNLEPGQDPEALAARANMTTIVRMLHDKSSQLMDLLVMALSKGKLCVVDVSQLRGGQALVLSGLILRRIFDRNQEEFTAADPETIPTIAVVEEAQSVLNEKSISAEPYITWVKEGRKYDLGAVMVTQQPGSIPMEILSQGDNWFIFHLLSAADLMNVRKANAHFSEDLLGALLNEPIPGQGVFWSSVGGKPYPVSIRVLSFEKMYSVLDPERNRPRADTYARELKRQAREMMGHDADVETAAQGAGVESLIEVLEGIQIEDLEPPDAMEEIEQLAIQTLEEDEVRLEQIRTQGLAWGALKAFFAEILPSGLDDRDKFAYHLVPKALTQLFGAQDDGWHSYKHPETGATYVTAGRNEVEEPL
jgi:hypothetical protein